MSFWMDEYMKQCIDCGGQHHTFKNTLAMCQAHARTFTYCDHVFPLSVTSVGKVPISLSFFTCKDKGNSETMCWESCSVEEQEGACLWSTHQR